MTAPIAQLVPATAAGTGWTWLQSAVEMAALLSGHWPVDPDGAGVRIAGGGEPGWSAAPRVATRTPRLAPHSVATARTFTLRTLRRWGADDCADDVAAVISELLTNALRHALPPGSASGIGALSPIRLALLHPGPCVLCAVADPSNQLPVPRRPDWLSETGRGLQVVTSLSHRWGYCPSPDQTGKVVWATVLTSSRLR
jgi:hypothetical protein